MGMEPGKGLAPGISSGPQFRMPRLVNVHVLLYVPNAVLGPTLGVSGLRCAVLGSPQALPGNVVEQRWDECYVSQEPAWPGSSLSSGLYGWEPCVGSGRMRLGQPQVPRTCPPE